MEHFAEILKDRQLQSFIPTRSVNWKFIVDSAPWWGGFHERLVISVKDVLRKIFGRALLTFEELTTLFTDKLETASLYK